MNKRFQFISKEATESKLKKEDEVPVPHSEFEIDFEPWRRSFSD